jgi:hypothetical protein
VRFVRHTMVFSLQAEKKLDNYGGNQKGNAAEIQFKLLNIL